MLNLNDQNVLMQIMQETNQKWRNCRRKQYNIYACKMPRGVIFANKLEQPHSFNAIKRILGKYIATEDECRKHPDLMQILSRNFCYKTDGNCITLCGTAGELWTVTEEKLRSAYTSTNGAPITEIPKGWFTVSRAAEAQAQAVGIYIPRKYEGVYQTSWGAALFVNSPSSDGHNMGDILVAPMVNGNINLADCSPTNNTVFARTYDLSVGGWGSLGIKANASRSFTLEDCKRLYRVPKTAGIMYSFQGMLNDLSDKEHLIPRMGCGYYDLDKSDTVWFEPVEDSRISYLYKGFYSGVLDYGDFFYVLFRNVVGEGFDFDVKVPKSVDAVKECMQDVIGKAKQGYQLYVDTYKYVVSNYGDRDKATTGEVMEDYESIKKAGEFEGRWVGLKDSILKHFGINSTDSDAYVAVRLAFDKIASGFTSHVDVWVQGDNVPGVEKKLGKSLHCGAKNLLVIKKCVTAMMDAVQKL